MKNVLLIALLLFTTVSCDDDLIELKATVSHDGQKIVMVNNDDFFYQECTLILNGKYKISQSMIMNNSNYSFPFSDFANSKGERFHFGLKPYSFTILCYKYVGDERLPCAVTVNWN